MKCPNCGYDLNPPPSPSRTQVSLLADGSRSVKEIAEEIGISTSRVSQHLKELRKAGHAAVVRRHVAIRK